MTLFGEQVPDVIILGGDPYALYTLPLADWLEKNKDRPSFQKRTEQCARGYIARWEVRGTDLWLISLHAWDMDGGRVGVPELFGGQKEIPADWYSGPADFEPSMELIERGVKPGMHRVWFKDGTVVPVPEQNAKGVDNPARE